VDHVERLLLLWDELDDLVGACRHVAVSAADEVASLAGPLAAAASTLGAGLLSLHWQAHIALLGSAAATHWML
jgi:hypothetical protein